MYAHNFWIGSGNVLVSNTMQFEKKFNFLKDSKIFHHTEKTHFKNINSSKLNNYILEKNVFLCIISGYYIYKNKIIKKNAWYSIFLSFQILLAKNL